MNAQFFEWVRERDAGVFLPAPTDVVLAAGQVLQPDLLFIEDDNPGEVVDGRFHGAPDLAVEIISPTSRSRDSIVKSMRYARFGVREFWLVDPDLRTMSAYDLVDGLSIERVADAEGGLTSGVMVGLRIDPASLFADVDRAIKRGRPDV